MTRSGCGAAVVGALTRLRGTWFDSTPTTLHSGSSKNGPGSCRHACDALGLDERCPTRKGSTHGCRFDSCPLYSCGRSSMVEQQPFGVLPVAWFDSRRPHLWPSSPNTGRRLLAYDNAVPLGIEAAAADTGGSCGPRGGSNPCRPAAVRRR